MVCDELFTKSSAPPAPVYCRRTGQGIDIKVQRVRGVLQDIALRRERDTAVPPQLQR